MSKILNKIKITGLGSKEIAKKIKECFKQIPQKGCWELRLDSKENVTAETLKTEMNKLGLKNWLFFISTLSKERLTIKRMPGDGCLTY